VQQMAPQSDSIQATSWCANATTSESIFGFYLLNVFPL